MCHRKEHFVACSALLSGRLPIPNHA
jgi:hypothetical protein